MKRNPFRTALAAPAIVAALMLSPEAPAHHSFASEFDINQPFEVTGTVKEILWTNPHARLHVDVEGANGEIVTYDFELLSPNMLIRDGWSRNDLKPGDPITVTGHRARNRPTVGRATGVIRGSGERVFGGAGSSGLEN
ncbi:DUF6152 family protein [Candidatus Rariloculus sp.]|uniref:DUF6152 family protein n=1 Tax=Candidatus Rariloculus sp. TaxID=3101265 RepID=UPI003D0EF663